MFTQRPGQKLLYLDDFTQVCAPGGGALPWYTGAYAAYDAKGAASYAASLLDLTGNGRNATTGAQPGWANGTGWIFSGIGQYLITPVVPTSASWTYYVKFSGAPTSGGSRTLFGASTTVGRRVGLILNVGGSTSHQYGNGGTINTAGQPSSGAYAISGPSGYFFDGLTTTEETTVISNWTLASTIALYIARFADDAGIPAFLGNMSSFRVDNATNSAANIGAILAAMP